MKISYRSDITQEESGICNISTWCVSIVKLYIILLLSEENCAGFSEAYTGKQNSSVLVNL